MKNYNTYQAKNAVKAAQVTNHIESRKAQGVEHNEAKTEAYYIYNIKKGKKIILKSFKYGTPAKSLVYK